MNAEGWTCVRCGRRAPEKPRDELFTNLVGAWMLIDNGPLSYRLGRGPRWQAVCADCITDVEQREMDEADAWLDIRADLADSEEFLSLYAQIDESGG